MATLHKLELYIVDFDDDWELMKDLLQYTADRADLLYKVASHEQSKEFEWEDDIKINKIDCTIEDYEEYFKKSNFECIYLSVDGKCNENYCLGIDEEDNKTIEDCPKCNRYNDCLHCYWNYHKRIEDINCSSCKKEN